MASFAVVLRSRPTTVDGILLMVDERRDAEEIAIELRRRGHPVDVREMTGAFASGAATPDPTGT